MTTNPSFNFVCQMGHWLAGAAAVMASYILFGPHWELVTALAGIGLAAFKEFYYDMHYESPDVSGGESGGLEDFGFYVLGIGTGILVLWIH